MTFPGGARAAADDAWSQKEEVEAERERHGAANPNGAPEGLSLNDFHAFMPMHNYMFARPVSCGRPPASTPASARSN